MPGRAAVRGWPRGRKRERAVGRLGAGHRRVACGRGVRDQQAAAAAGGREARAGHRHGAESLRNRAEWSAQAAARRRASNRLRRTSRGAHTLPIERGVDGEHAIEERDADARVQQRREANRDAQLARDRPPQHKRNAIARADEFVDGVEDGERRTLRQHRPRPFADDLREAATGAPVTVDDRLRRDAQLAQLLGRDADGEVAPVNLETEHADAVDGGRLHLRRLHRKAPPLRRRDVITLLLGEFVAVEPKLRKVIDVDEVPRPIDA